MMGVEAHLAPHAVTPGPDPARAPLQGRPALLLDLDGTLVDSARDIAASLNHVLAGDGAAPYALQDVKAMIGDGAAELLRKAYERRRRVPPHDALDRFRAHHADHCTDATRPYDGMVEMLRALRARRPGRRVAIVTNKPTAFAEKLVVALDLRELIDAVVGPELVAARKPAAAHVLGALSRLGAAAADAVMVGDGTTDILAGRAAGAATVAALWGYRSRAELEAAGPDVLAPRPRDLAALLGVGSDA
jgi:phosphoglycolate phosphatase